MITIYKKKAIKNMELVALNDVYFNKYTSDMLDEKAADIIKKMLNIDKLSTGCKTVLNIMYNPDKVFDICECGDNALDVIYSLPEGNVYCDYPFISFDMEKVNVCDKSGVHEVTSYEELKEWWTNED